MKEYVILNKTNGEIGLGVKLQVFDHPNNEPLANFEGYSVSLKHENEFQFWGIKAEETSPYIVVPKEMIDVQSNLEIVCEL